MPIPPAEFTLWNWGIAHRMNDEEVRAALAAAIRRPVVPLDAPRDGAVLCDVWYGGGDFPTSVDSYLAPAGLDEASVAAAFAAALGVACLLPDDTLDPTRHLLAGADGTVRPVHIELADTEQADVRTGLRPCGTQNAGCRASPRCSQSRWPPDPAPPA